MLSPRKTARQVVLARLCHLHAARGHFFQMQVTGKIVQQGRAPSTEAIGPVEKNFAIGAGGQSPFLHAQPVTPVGRRRVPAGEAGVKIFHGHGSCPPHAPLRRHATGKTLEGPGQQAQDVFQPLPVPGQVFPRKPDTEARPPVVIPGRGIVEAQAFRALPCQAHGAQGQDVAHLFLQQGQAGLEIAPGKFQSLHHDHLLGAVSADCPHLLPSGRGTA